MSDAYTPRAEHKFSFGLWTISNRGRDPFGDVVREPLKPVDAVAMLAEIGAWGVNLHDNDLVPIDATPAERDRIVGEFRAACQRHGIVVPMVTVSLFFDPAFKDGAFTANDPAVRAYAVQKTMRAMDIGAELGAKIFVLWGGREGTETDACRRPDEAVKRLRAAVNFLCEYSIDRKVRLPVRAGGQAERTAWRHLHGDHGQLPRLHPDGRPARDGRSQSGVRARDDGGPELRARGGTGLGGGQALPHRPQRSGDRPLRPGLPVRRREPEDAPSSS